MALRESIKVENIFNIFGRNPPGTVSILDRISYGQGQHPKRRNYLIVLLLPPFLMPLPVPLSGAIHLSNRLPSIY